MPAPALVRRVGEERPRRGPGQAQALAGEVGLVGVTARDGEGGEPVACGSAARRERLLGVREEALKVQRAVQCLGTEPDRGLDATPQVRGRVRCDLLDPHGRDHVRERGRGRPLDVALHVPHPARPAQDEAKALTWDVKPGESIQALLAAERGPTTRVSPG